MVKAKDAKGKASTAAASKKRSRDDDTNESDAKTSKAKAKAPVRKKAKPSASQTKSSAVQDTSTEEIRKAVKALLKDLASEHLNDIEDDEERQQVQQGLSALVKGLLAKLKTATLPESATLMPVDQVNTASTSKMAPDQLELKDLKAQLKEEEALLAEETAAFKTFRKSRHEVEAIEREEQAAKLHPLVKVLYPEMGNGKAAPADEAAADEQPWLREALERLDSLQQERQDRDEREVDEDLYDPKKDKWLKKYTGGLLQLLGKIDHATTDLEILSESVVAATSTLDVVEED